MRILSEPVTKKVLLETSTCILGDDMLKGVVDVSRGIVAVDADLHADLEHLLLQDGSNQKDLWGFNLYLTEEDPADFLEFDSLINIRPSQGNRSRNVEDETTRKMIREIIGKWVS